MHISHLQNIVHIQKFQNQAVAKIENISYPKHFGSEILSLYICRRVVLQLFGDIEN